MKHQFVIDNHEKWHECTNCHQTFDMRLEGLICPSCGTDNSK